MKKFIVLVVFSTFSLLSGCGSGNSNNYSSSSSSSSSSSQANSSSSTSVTSSSVVSSVSSTSSSSSVATTASQVKSGVVKSEVLKTDMGFDIYLPKDYDQNIKYPVLYSLHFFDGNQHTLLGGLISLNANADTLIANGKIQPMIIVTPDYKNSFGANTTLEQGPAAAGTVIGLYKDYLVKELIPYIDSHYSTITQREGRFIDGYSMGGFAALHVGFLHPELFSKVGAHSAAFWDYAADDLYTDRRDWLYATPELRKERDPFLLAKTQDLKSTKVYVDVGTSDSLAGVDERFYLLLLSLGINAEWHTSSGAHTLAYWKANTDNYFLFFSGK